LTSLSEQETFEQEDIALARATRRLRKELSLSNCTEEEVEEHIRAMPSHYLLSQSLNEIALHISFVRRVRADEVVVDFHEERNATYTELTLCTFDDPVPGLLAKITGVLYAAGLDVHAAQVTTRVSDTDRIALDTLWVDYRGRPLSPGKRRKVSDTLIAVLSGKKSLEEVLKQPASPFTPRTRNGTEKQTFSENICVSEVRNDISEHFTVIETSGSDTRSALFRVARALSHLGWDIRSARVSLWRGVARTSFYVEGARHLSEDSVRSTLNQVLQTEEGTRAESRSSHP
jgi:UTP:GlnB (protein PII) uridylyltransferase